MRDGPAAREHYIQMQGGARAREREARVVVAVARGLSEEVPGRGESGRCIYVCECVCGGRRGRASEIRVYAETLAGLV